MKRSMREIEKRRTRLMNFLKDESASYSEICRSLSISEVTLHRDLKTLEQMGKIVRKRGRSYVKDYLSMDENPIDKIENIKNKIGKVAANLIHEDQKIFINSGSTPLYALRHLADKKITVLTNNLRAADLEMSPESTLLLSGGEVTYPKKSMVGEYASDFFNTMTADAAIISVYGFSASNGITSPNLKEARINNTIISRTNGPVIVVADYRKIELVSNFRSGNFSKITYLITDSYTEKGAVDAFEKLGIKVLQVPI